MVESYCNIRYQVIGYFICLVNIYYIVLELVKIN